MKLRVMLAGLLLFVFCPLAAAGEAEAARVFEDGAALLQQGDFDGALAAYAEACKSDESNTEYRQKFMQLRKVIALRKALGAEDDPARWQSTASALRNFYYSNRLYGELLQLAQEMHQRKASVGTATLLADAMLSLEQNAEAVAVLDAFAEQDLPLQALLLKGVGLGRVSRVDEANVILASLTLPETPSPRVLFDVARLEVLCGKVDEGMVTLTTALENTSPKAIGSFREFVKGAPEFRALPAVADFEQVLLTESQVDESSCSGGSSCGSCSMKGGCSSAKKEDAPKEEGGCSGGGCGGGCGGDG